LSEHDGETTEQTARRGSANQRKYLLKSVKIKCGDIDTTQTTDQLLKLEAEADKQIVDSTVRQHCEQHYEQHRDSIVSQHYEQHCEQHCEPALWAASGQHCEPAL
jgi:hypothetical protein